MPDLERAYKFAFLYGDCEYFQWFVKKTKENLKNVIKWKKLRRGNPNIDTIWSEQKQDLDENAITNLRFGIVTRAFLFHLKWPTKYPIFDTSVFRAMKKIKGEMPKDKNIYIKDEEDCRRYREFFNKYFQDNEGEITSKNFPILMDVAESFSEFDLKPVA